MGSYDLMVAGAAKGQGIREGYAQGERDGFEDGKRSGRIQGRNQGIEEMKPWQERADFLESIFAEGGLHRLWLNKVLFATLPASNKKETLTTRRLVFLHMLAYAEYHQHHVKDPVNLLGKLSNDMAREAAIAKRSGDKATSDQIMDNMIAMSQATNKTANSIKQCQKDDNLEKWIEWRVKGLLALVQYSSDKGVVPIPESLGGSVTTKKAGAEIAEDSFDIVSDAKKYLGETRDYFGY